MHGCFGCGSSYVLMKCSRCDVVTFCSKQCAEKDWKKGSPHRRHCKVLAAALGKHDNHNKKMTSYAVIGLKPGDDVIEISDDDDVIEISDDENGNDDDDDGARRGTKRPRDPPSSGEDVGEARKRQRRVARDYSPPDASPAVVRAVQDILPGIVNDVAQDKILSLLSVRQLLEMRRISREMEEAVFRTIRNNRLALPVDFLLSIENNMELMKRLGKYVRVIEMPENWLLQFFVYDLFMNQTKDPSVVPLPGTNYAAIFPNVETLIISVTGGQNYLDAVANSWPSVVELHIQRPLKTIPASLAGRLRVLRLLETAGRFHPNDEVLILPESMPLLREFYGGSYSEYKIILQRLPSDMSNIQVLDFGTLAISKEVRMPESLPRLRVLRFGRWNVEIQRFSSSMPELQELRLGGVRLTEWPSNVSSLRHLHLQWGHLPDNLFGRLPLSLAEQLHVLDLGESGGNINDLETTNMPNLEVLRLNNNNNIESLPMPMPKLRELSLGSCHSLTVELGLEQFPALRILDVGSHRNPPLIPANLAERLQAFYIFGHGPDTSYDMPESMPALRICEFRANKGTLPRDAANLEVLILFEFSKGVDALPVSLPRLRLLNLSTNTSIPRLPQSISTLHGLALDVESPIRDLTGCTNLRRLAIGSHLGWKFVTRENAEGIYGFHFAPGVELMANSRVRFFPDLYTGYYEPTWYGR